MVRTVRRLEDRLSELAQSRLDVLAGPADEVTFGVHLSETMVEGECDGEPVQYMTPCVGLILSVRSPDCPGSLTGQAALPIPFACTPEGFMRGLESLWQHLEFQRLTMKLPDVAAASKEIIADES
jgi:hypothetical protein